MKTTSLLFRFVACLLIVTATASLHAQGTAFTYQGRLNSGGTPATGSYDVQFTIYDALTNGNVIAGPLTNSATGVTNGLFTVTLDFGNVFNGSNLWLELGVRTNGVDAFTTLAPRQQVTPTPYAILAGASVTAGSVNGLQVQPNNSGGPNLVGGAPINYVAPGVVGAVIAGGGATNYDVGFTYSNSVSDDFGAIGGGRQNTISRNAGSGTIAGGDNNSLTFGGFSTIAGGQQNTISSPFGTIGGGEDNTIQKEALDATIAGGGGNTIQAVPFSPPDGSTIGGGDANTIEPGNNYATIAGGSGNTIQFNNQFGLSGGAAAIGGGYLNLIGTNADSATIAGGLNNAIGTNAVAATIAGGQYNTVGASAQNGTIAGGVHNSVGAYDFVGGGEYNSVQADHSVIVGGAHNTVQTGALYATVVGGLSNVAGGSYSFAAGRQAKAGFDGDFVFGDAQSADFAATSSNQFLIRAAGGVGINMNNPQSGLAVNGTVAATSFAGSGAGLNGITSAGLADGAVTASKLADGAALTNLQASGITGLSGGVSLSSFQPGPNSTNGGPVTISTKLVLDGWVTLVGSPSARANHTAVWTGSEMIIWGGYNGSAYLNDGQRYDPALNSWQAISGTGAPGARAQHTAVWTGSDMIVWGGLNSAGACGDGGIYNLGSDGWIAIPADVNSPLPRSGHTAVWDTVNGAMTVWGGLGNNNTVFGDGYRFYRDVFVPSGAWEPLTGEHAYSPSARCYHTAVWDPNLGRMLVWGGYDSPNQVTKGDGGIYDVFLGEWFTMSTNNAPTARYRHTAVWTGTNMIVWGGIGTNTLGQSNVLNNGAMFSDGGYTNGGSWLAISSNNVPVGRWGHTAVWTGSNMIVWGGYTNVFPFNSGANTGGRYDPVVNGWLSTTLSDPNLPEARGGHTAVWSGTYMVVWGGNNGNSYWNDGGRYDPVGDAWLSTYLNAAPTPRQDATAVWNGAEVWVWGGYNGSYLNDGGRFNPALNTWLALPASPLTGRRYHTAVWTGTEMVIYGGYNGSPWNDCATLDSATLTWTILTSPGGISARYNHSAVWTGSQMMVWGGTADGTSTFYNDGAILNPQNGNGWSYFPNPGRPTAREYHTAVWTGTGMLVWGGYNGSPLGDGGEFFPNINAWEAVSSTSAPSARYGHTAVWDSTDLAMLVWGGFGTSSPLGDGAVFSANLGTWTPMDSNGAPGPRSHHTAVWDGSEMIIWGGLDSANKPLNGGGRYDPVADAWTATAMSRAPTKRSGQAATWTGSQMFIWGGNGRQPFSAVNSYLNDTYLYTVNAFWLTYPVLRP